MEIHWPKPAEDIEAAWSTPVELEAAGVVKHIGVSNCDVAQLRRIGAIAPVETLTVTQCLRIKCSHLRKRVSSVLRAPSTARARARHGPSIGRPERVSSSLSRVTFADGRRTVSENSDLDRAEAPTLIRHTRRRASSTRRALNPYSLSYQAATDASVPP
jgi:hypothetical protein